MSDMGEGSPYAHAQEQVEALENYAKALRLALIHVLPLAWRDPKTVEELGVLKKAQRLSDINPFT